MGAGVEQAGHQGLGRECELVAIEAEQVDRLAAELEADEAPHAQLVAHDRGHRAGVAALDLGRGLGHDPPGLDGRRELGLELVDADDPEGLARVGVVLAAEELGELARVRDAERGREGAETSAPVHGLLVLLVLGLVLGLVSVPVPVPATETHALAAFFVVRTLLLAHLGQLLGLASLASLLGRGRELLTPALVAGEHHVLGVLRQGRVETAGLEALDVDHEQGRDRLGREAAAVGQDAGARVLHADVPEFAQEQGRVVGLVPPPVDLDETKGRVGDQIAPVGLEGDELLEEVEGAVVTLERVHAVAAVAIQALGLALARAHDRGAVGVGRLPHGLAVPAAPRDQGSEHEHGYEQAIETRGRHLLLLADRRAHSSPAPRRSPQTAISGRPMIPV